MTIETLKKLCLQYLEQDSETNVLDSTITDLAINDTFAEYMLNMDHVIYMALSRIATSQIIPLCEFEIPKGENVVYLIEKGSKKPIYHEIKEVYYLDENNVIGKNVKWTLIGSKIIIKDMIPEYQYYIVYSPTINMLDTYLSDEIDNINDIELSDIGERHICIPDEMAINIKYLVYSEMKLEENASVANINKNYFESYLASMQTTQIQTNQVEVEMMDWGDIYGD